MEAADGEERNVHGVRWRDVCEGQHAVVDAGGSSGLLGVVGEEVRLPSCISSSSSALLCCLFWRTHLGPSMPAISGLSGRGGGGHGVHSKWRDGVGVVGREMGPPLWADVFTLKMVTWPYSTPHKP